MFKNTEMDFFSKKMFSKLFIPSIISYIFLAFGDVADAIVVGNKLGITGLAAISLALPVFMLINVIMHGFGAGGSIVYSRLMGEGKKEEAICNFNSVLRITIIIGLLMSILGNLFIKKILLILGTNPQDGILYITTLEYIRIIITGSPLIIFAYILNYYLRNAGKETIASIGFTIANISDVILNILLVLVLDIGVKGAALSTIIGQIISIMIYFPHLFGKNSELKISLLKSEKLSDTFKSFRIGFSSSIQYIFTFIFILSVNNILMYISGDIGVAVFDFIQNVSYVILYLYEGTAKAAQPIVSTFSGERNVYGQKSIFIYSVIVGSLIGGVVIGAIAIYPEFMCAIFGITGEQAIELATLALRIYCIGAFFAGINTLLEVFEQAKEKEKEAFLIAILRGAVILIPLTFIFSLLGIEYFWLVFPVTEIISLGVFLIFKKCKKKHENDIDIDRIYSCTISNSFKDMEVLMNAIDEFCDKWDASPEQKIYVVMTIEEICVAIINQFENNEDGRIQLTLIAYENEEFELHIRDNADSFNPFELETELANEDGDFNMDAMGMLVIKNTAKNFFYRKYQGFNTLVVRI